MKKVSIQYLTLSHILLVVNEERGDDEQIEEEGDEDDMKDLEEAAPVTEELTEKDRLQQARGGSNLLEDPKFTKYLNVIILIFPDFSLKF